MSTFGSRIASEFSLDKCHLTDAEQRRLADMIDERSKCLIDGCRALGDRTEGCRCENNGGGDCEWCRRLEVVRVAIGDINA